ncbi:hypothetical protein BKA70DRAFT_1565635 [Coprinopsis sp. MPI-PUGE-AT-0042]|nr:hypothetical protein BKA70DRAFT_1565635 [Coprinopsis sp. MPI-PUGE-AT-0042]
MALYPTTTLPTDVLYVVAGMLAGESDIVFVNQKPINASFDALRNLALTSLALRDISQPYLFYKLSIHTGKSSSYDPEKVDERISVFQRNPQLLDYIRRFDLKFSRGDWLMSSHDTHLETCRRFLDYLLPHLQRLEVFTTEFQYLSVPWRWHQWGQKTQMAFSSCFARNPLKRVEIKGWDGELCFLTSLPASVHTLKIDRGAVEMSAGSETTLKLRPKTFQLDIAWRVPPFLSTNGLHLLMQLHTLDLWVVTHHSLKGVLGLAPQTLACLRLRYRPHSAESLRVYMLGKLRDSFFRLPYLQELDISANVENSIPKAVTADAVAELFMENLSPAFSSIRKLIFPVGWSVEHEDTTGTLDGFITANDFQGITGEFGKLDRYLAGSTCVFSYLKQVIVEVELQWLRRKQNLRGEVEPWMLKKAEEAMLVTMSNIRFKYDFTVKSVGGPVRNI